MSASKKSRVGLTELIVRKIASLTPTGGARPSLVTHASEDVHYDINPKRRGHHRAPRAGVGFEGVGEDVKLVGTTDFVYPTADEKENCSVEEFEEHAERELFMLFGSLWAEVMEWVYLPKNSRLVGLRFLAVIYCCRPQLMRESTMEKIAKRQGIKKQTFQDLTVKFTDQFNFVCRSMRKESSKEHMRAAALRIHARKNAAKISATPR